MPKKNQPAARPAFAKRIARQAAANDRSNNQPGLIAPLIHLNGDRKEDLLVPLANAGKAIKLAQEMLKATAPTARNYYPISPEAFELAREQYGLQQEHLQLVYNELTAVFNAIIQGKTEAAITPVNLMEDDESNLMGEGNEETK